MKRLVLAAVLMLPIVGLAAGIGVREASLSGASEWRIPITGYDPRDPVRGHYVQFVYDWRVEGSTAHCEIGSACELCLAHGPGVVTATIRAPGGACANRVEMAGSSMQASRMLQGSPSTLRFSGRIFVSEASAPGLDDALRKSPMVIVARLTRGGRLINERLEPAVSAR